MNNNEISNPKVEVPATPELNDCDYLNIALSCEKTMAKNLTVVLTEASNEVLFNKIYPIYKNMIDIQRELYELAFDKGWYKVEKAEENKISQKYNELNQKTNELA